MVPTRRATQFSHFYSDREFLNTEAWAEHYRVEDPVRACLGVRLPGRLARPPRAVHAIYLHRTSPTAMSCC